ncbi:MAG: DNA adenine methylase [Treponema sp.]|nr:DNA adenine methylase [Treponema sp.]
MEQREQQIQENQDYLQTQLITYIGNKRALLPFIGQAVDIIKEKLAKEKLDCLDIFAGSGIVARYLKQYSNSITVNDLEEYACIISRCYLSDLSDKQKAELETLYTVLISKIDERMKELKISRENGTYKNPGFISKYYAPENLDDIKPGERCFYTPYNADYLDVSRQLIDELIPEEYKDFFIAPLLSEASIHANTAGIFKGFYKNSKTKTGQFGGNGRNALTRIMGNIELQLPVLSNFSAKHKVFNANANELIFNTDLYSHLTEDSKGNRCFDLAYFDPPYNQHPYGSNYFMLNLLANYKCPDEENMSRVSGIPKNWNRSAYNKKKQVCQVFYELVDKVKAKFVLVSFNSEGFISKQEMIEILSRCGNVEVLEAQYNAFRGSRNLNERDIHVKEYLFLVEKNSN